MNRIAPEGAVGSRIRVVCRVIRTQNDIAGTVDERELNRTTHRRTAIHIAEIYM